MEENPRAEKEFTYKIKKIKTNNFKETSSPSKAFDSIPNSGSVSEDSNGANSPLKVY
jgi:hypothetical protein